MSSRPGLPPSLPRLSDRLTAAHERADERTRNRPLALVTGILLILATIGIAIVTTRMMMSL